MDSYPLDIFTIQWRPAHLSGAELRVDRNVVCDVANVSKIPEDRGAEWTSKGITGIPHRYTFDTAARGEDRSHSSGGVVSTKNRAG
jgi:hypothetical protein